MPKKPGLYDLNKGLKKTKQSAYDAYQQYLNNAMAETAAYAQQSGKNRQEVANTVLGGGPMTSLKQGDIGAFNWDNQRMHEIGRAAVNKAYRAMGLFDDPRYATNKGYVSLVSDEYLNSYLGEVEKQIAEEQKKDAAKKARNDYRVNTWQLWSDFNNRKDAMQDAEKWAYADYLLNGDLSSNFSLDAYNDRWDEMDDNEFFADQKSMKTQYENLDWATLTNKDASVEDQLYESQTGKYEGYKNVITDEINRRAQLNTLQNSIRSDANYGTLSAYTDTYVEPDKSDLAYSFSNQPFIQGYDDLPRFINTNATWAEKTVAAEYSAKVRGYLDNGYDYMTQDELADYNALINAGRTEEAAQYLDLLSSELLYRRAMVMQEYQRAKATNAWLAAPTWVEAGAQQIANVFYLPQQIYEAAVGKDNPYSSAYDALNKSQWTTSAQLDAIAESNMPDWLKTVSTYGYQGVTGFRDNAMRILAGGGSPTVSLIIAGLQSGSGSLHESSERDDMSGAAKIIKAIGTAAVEMGTEKVGLDALFSKGKNGALAYMKNVIISEVGEEVLNAASEPVLEAVVAYLFDHEADIMSGPEFWQNLTDTAITTAISSIFMGGGGAISNEVGTRSIGRNVTKNGDLEGVLRIAESYSNNADVATPAQKIRDKQAKGFKVTARDMGELVHSLSNAVGEKNSKVLTDVLTDSVESRLEELGEDPSNAKKLAQSISNMYLGKKITMAERASLKWSDAASQVFKELNTTETVSKNVVPGSIAGTEGQLEDGQYVAGNALAAEKNRVGHSWKTAADEKIVAAQRDAFIETAKLNEALNTKTSTTTAVGKAHDKAKNLLKGKPKMATREVMAEGSDGKEVTGTFERVERKNGKLLMVMKDASDAEVKVDADKITNSGDEGILTIINYAQEGARHEMSADEVNTMVNTYLHEGGDVGSFVQQFQDNYLSGYSGVNAPAGTISGGIASIAYEQGKAEAIKDEADRVARAQKARKVETPSVGWLGDVTSDTSIKGLGDAGGLNEAVKNMTTTQQAMVEFGRHLAKSAKINVVFFASKAGADGKYTTQNGSYDPNTHTIYLDINSGASTESGRQELMKSGTLGAAIGRVAGHELTHVLEATSPEYYGKYKQAVKAALKTKSLDYASLVREKIDAALANGNKLTYAGAEAEVIADASEYMLQDSKFVKNMDQGLKGKVKEIVQKFLNKVNEAFRALTGGHIESAALRTMTDGVAHYEKQLQELWDMAFDEMLGAEVKVDAPVAEATGETETVQKSRERDDAYMAAVERGDMVTAQKMVDEAAKSAGYEPVKLYHGTRQFGFTKFDTGKSDDKMSIFVTDDRRIAESYSREGADIPVKNGIKQERYDFMQQSSAKLEPYVQKWVDKNLKVPTEMELRAYTDGESATILSAVDWVDDYLQSNWDSLNTEAKSAISKAMFYAEKLAAIPTADMEDETDGYALRMKFEDAVQDLAWEDRNAYEEIAPVLSRPVYESANNLISARFNDPFYNVNDGTFVSKWDVTDKLGDKLFTGIYELYGDMENLLEIDANDSNWNTIDGKTIGRDGVFVTTREVAEFAKKNGFNGVEIKNVRDGGGMTGYHAASNVLIFFDSTALKSADPVTYDDSGNVIPLSERFNAAKEDIRYSLRNVDHSEATLQENMRLVQKMNPVARLRGNEFKMGKTLKADVKKYYASIGGAAHSPLFGQIILSNSGIKDSLGHGMGPVKAVMYHAVPNVISDGKMIDYRDNWKKRGYDTALIAAPVSIKEGEYKGDYWVGVILNLYADSTQRFYVHEPIVVQKRSAPVVQTGTPEGATPGNEDSSIISILDKLNEVKQEIKETDTDDSSPDGIEIDEDTESAYPTQKSIRTWADSDYVAHRNEAAEHLAKTIGVSTRKAKKWIDDVNSVSAYILGNKARLDYIPTAVKSMSAFKSNPEYGGSIDMSTICAKRRLATGTLDAIQRVLGDAVLTKDDFLHIREMMKERGHEVACGLCFVESSRKNLSKYNKQFLDQYKTEHPDSELGMVDLNTVEGLERIRSNPETADVYAAYEKFMNKLAQRKPKLFEKRTEYNHEILKKFKSDTTVGVKNRNGGLRLQSFSDFEIVHLIDMMQVITDMASVGLAGQAYTKVPDFAWALGDTGLKINLSLIAKGVDAAGNLIFDDVEGMSHLEAEKLRNAYSKNVGTIVVTFTDEQTIAAMKSDFIDYIIPFHRSQWQKGDYKKLGLPEGTKDYTIHQNEKEGRKRVKENFLPNAYWQDDLSGTENAEYYLDMCAKAGRTPKFAKFLVNNGNGSYSLQPDGSTDGYWKLLIDFKMYDNDGNRSKQLPVQPNFNMKQAMRMLENYKGEHDSFPVAQDVVDAFVKEYRGDVGGVKNTDGRYTVSPVQKSIRDLPEDTVTYRDYLTEADSSIAATIEERNALSIYQELLKNHAEASEEVIEAETALAAADKAHKPKARKALAAARVKQKDLYNRLLNVERQAHVQTLVKRSNQIIGDLYGKDQTELDKMLADKERRIASLKADLTGLNGAARTQREADIREQEREVAALKSKATKALLANSKRYQQQIADIRLRRDINIEIGKRTRHIKRIVKRLNDRIIHEEDYKNVKEPLKPVVHKLVQTFIDGFGNMVFDAKTAGKLKSVYDMLKQEDETAEYFDEEASDWLTTLAELARQDEARRTSGSTLENLNDKLYIYTTLSDIVDHVAHMVTAADTMFIEGKKAEASAVTEEVGNTLAAKKDRRELAGWAGKLARFADNLIVKGNMMPQFFFEGLNNKGMMRLYDDLQSGVRKYSERMLVGDEFLSDVMRRHGYHTWGGMKKPVSFKTKQGHTIYLTRENMMWIYATAKREASNPMMNTHHLDEGGITYEEIPTEKGRQIEGKGVHHLIVAEDVAEITKMLTAEQIAYVDECVEFLSTECAEWGNEASLKLFGIKKYKEGYYFPFKVDSGQLHKNSAAGATSTVSDARVKHISFSHSIKKGANTPLVMGNFTSVIADHINQMATYSGMVVPIENMNRVLNRKVDDGRELVNIRSLIARKHGDNTSKYIDDLLKDLNGGPQTDNRGSLDAGLRLFKRNAVVGKLSVALQQPTAVTRAFAYISPRWFANLHLERPKHTWDRMMKYSSTTFLKDMGGFNVGMGKGASNWLERGDLGNYRVYKRAKFLLDQKSFKDAVDEWNDFLTGLPGFMDKITWCAIWNATENEQAHQHPSMDRNSDEFLELVGRRFDDIVNHTQVYDSILSKSQNMRSKNAIAKMATSFMAESTLNMNLAYRAIASKDGKQIAKVTASLILNAVLGAAAYALIGAFNKDDDDRTLEEKYATAFAGRLADNLNPLASIPYLSDLWNKLQGYDVERTDLSFLFDLIEDGGKFWNKMTDPEETLSYRDYENFVGGLISTATGIPAKNWMGDARRIWNMTHTSTADAPFSSVWYGILDEVVPGRESTSTAYYGRYLSALRDGDKQEQYDLKEFLTKTKGTKEEAITEGVRNAYKTEYQRGGIDKQTAIKFLLDNNLVSGETADKKKQKAFQFVDKWDEGTEGYSAYNTLTDALAGGNTSSIQTAWKELTSNGYNDKQVKTQVKTLIKELVQEKKITAAQATTLLKKWSPYEKDKDNQNKPLEWLKENK